MNRERALGKSVVQWLQQKAESLGLSPQAQTRVIEALECDRCDRQKETVSWHFALPEVIVAGLIVACIFIGVFLFWGRTGDKTAQSQGVEERSPVLVHTFYVVPTYTFRKEANVVIDSLTYVTNEVTLTLWMAKR